MGKVIISNIGESKIRRYGVDFEPGEERMIDTEIIYAYSMMEIARTLQSINRKMAARARMDEMDEMRLLSGMPSFTGPTNIVNFPSRVDTHGWLERWWHNRKMNKAFKKAYKNRRQSHGS